MRFAMIILAAAFAMATMPVVHVSTAEAAAHVKKGKPGKCGTFWYYSKKDKGCVSKQ